MKKVISVKANSDDKIPDKAVYLCTQQIQEYMGCSVNVHYFLVDAN